MDRRDEIGADDAGVMVDDAAFGERRVARARTGLARGHADQALTRRHDVGEVLRVELVPVS